MDNTEKTLSALYDGLCKSMLEKLQSGDATAQDLNVIRQFLKDNNISSVASRGSPIANIIEAFPFQDKDEDNGGSHTQNASNG